MAWSCRSHSPPWSQIGQSSGWLMSRNSITPSRAFFTIGVRVLSTCGVPSFFGGRSFTPMAQEACGLGMPATSIRHIRQLPAIDRRSWKQKRGISAPAASQAWSNVYSGGTSISLPSTMILAMAVVFSSHFLVLVIAAPVVALGRCPDRIVPAVIRQIRNLRRRRKAPALAEDRMLAAGLAPCALGHRPPGLAVEAPQVPVVPRHCSAPRRGLALFRRDRSGRKLDAALRRPKLGISELRPAESVVARAARLEMIESLDALLERRAFVLRHPPQHQRRLDRLEPVLAAAIETAVHGLPDEAFERGGAFPNGQVRQDGRIAVDRHVHGVAAVVLQPPDEAVDLLGQGVDALHVVDELRHARIVERVADARDVELGEVHRAYSAACAVGSRTAPCGSALRV